jgi:hypothetical protein
MPTPTIRISRERKELLSKYATAAGFLYGVMSVSEFVDVFNQYEDAKTDENEAVLALQRLAKTDDVEYSVKGGLISEPDFLLSYKDEMENALYVRQQQKGKPRYLPSKDEFLRYADGEYFEPTKPYDNLRAYIIKSKLCTQTGIDGVDGDLIALREMIQNDVRNQDMLDYLSDRGYRFDSEKRFNEFFMLFTIAHNSTRMFENNGFTPNDIFEKYDRPKLKPLPKEPFNLNVISKVGRNELCPCGSGLKYKKCHGR